MSINIYNLSINKFNNICRACSRESENDLIPLYENVYLIGMLTSCAQIQFQINDGLPKQICLSCIEELNQTYTFTIKCRMVDAALKKCLTEHKLLNTKEEHDRNDNNETSTDDIICSQCNTVFKCLSDLIEHQQKQNHFCNNNFCLECKQQFDTKKDLILHLSTHCNVAVTPPKRNRKGIPRKNEVRISSSPVPENDASATKKDRLFTCQICNKVMNNLSNFRRHEQIHSGEKRFACTVCKKNFRHSGTLVTHQRSHSGERPCVCDVCGKTYIDLSTLGRHKKIHLGEKRFECNVCNKRFTQSGDLNVHKRLHTEKPFVCDVCLKRFNKMSHLRKHKKVHLKGSPGDGDSVT